MNVHSSIILNSQKSENYPNVHQLKKQNVVNPVNGMSKKGE
jgi:hypothetical protein